MFGSPDPNESFGRIFGVTDDVAPEAQRQPFAAATLSEALNLTHPQAEALEVLVEEMGIPLDRVQVATGALGAKVLPKTESPCSKAQRDR